MSVSSKTLFLSHPSRAQYTFITSSFCFPPYKLSHHLHQGISCVGSFLEQNMSSGLSVLKYEMQVALSKQPIPSCPQNSRTFYIRTQTRRFRCHPPGLPQIVTQQLTQADSKPQPFLLVFTVPSQSTGHSNAQDFSFLHSKEAVRVG